MAAINLKPFKVMQWNILADGLSQDGFLTRPTDRTAVNLKIRRGTEWDSIINAMVPDEEKTQLLLGSFKEPAALSNIREDGKMSELISDTMHFKRLVVEPVNDGLKEEVNYLLLIRICV